MKGRYSPLGLSPHARGNQLLDHRQQPGRGSIPARAGQPSTFSEVPARETVYPRTRGATSYSITGSNPAGGLSPHARGNRARGGATRVPARSIPARAGQPRSPARRHGRDSVYPRTRGATTIWRLGQRSRSGLSPHARGNLLRQLRARYRLGSIPARAGQPKSVPLGPATVTVYPRTRGATGFGGLGGNPASGLSPHARGNLAADVGEHRAGGSIPARAGQPYLSQCPSRSNQVYPRTRGATFQPRSPFVVGWGLSPHARGNLRAVHGGVLGGGSIPARAGQP